MILIKAASSDARRRLFYATAMMRTAIFPTKYETLDAMRVFVRQAAEDAGMEDGDSYKVQLAVDEACTNIIEHGCKGACDEEIEITCTTSEDALMIMIRDHGQPFDPTCVPDPDVHTDLRSRQVGGLGIYLMRQMMDEVRYETLGESGNVLTLVKHRKTEK